VTAVGSKCKVCKGPAVIDLPRHNAHFCAEHLQQLCRRQMARAIDDFDMIQPGDRVLVAVSGGKDSLAVWDMLVEAGYRADGLYIGLGIGEYSDESGGYARRFAEERGLALRVIDLRDDFGYDVPTASVATGRVPCSACGLSKRRLFDQAALDEVFQQQQNLVGLTRPGVGLAPAASGPPGCCRPGRSRATGRGRAARTRGDR